MEKIILPDEWQKSAEKILSKDGVTIVLGAVDAGKTTFISYLAKMAVNSGRVVGVVDADIGQSDIGPPTVIGLGIIDQDFNDLRAINPSGLYFVGSISPEGHLLPMVIGTQKMVSKARDLGARIILVDTTGLVYGRIARALKFYKIQLISPDNIVALQRKNEIEHLLRPFEGLNGITIYRLPVSNGVKRRSQEERQANRKERFSAFFKDVKILEIPFEDVRTSNTLFLSGRELTQAELNRLSKELDEIILYGESLPEGLYLVVSDLINRKSFREESFQERPEDFKNLLVGLANEKGETLSLGMIEEVHFTKRRFVIRTPLSTRESIRIIQFSQFKMNP